LWHEVQMVAAPDLILREIVFILLQLLAVAFEVLYHQVLPRKFVVVWEVVYYLSVVQPNTYFPVQVPVFGLNMLRTFQTVAQYTFQSSSSLSALVHPLARRFSITTSLSKSLFHRNFFEFIDAKTIMLGVVIYRTDPE
jgi:hypothetical protein